MRRVRFEMDLHLVAHTRQRVLVIKEWLHGKFIGKLLVRTFQEFSDDDGMHMAAGVAYYALFSLFPLLLGLVAVTGFFIESESVQVKEEITDWARKNLPGSGELIPNNIDAAIDQRGPLGVIAIFGLLWSGSAIFGAIGRAVNRAWDVHKDRPFYIAKARQLAMALGVGVLFALSLASAGLAQAATRFSEVDIPVLNLVDEIAGIVIFRAISILLTLTIFLILYKFMPNCKTYWRYIWPGAVLAAVLFELSKDLFILYLERFASFQEVYGSIGSIIAVLLWAYLGSMILIFGAELSSEYGRLREGVERGTLIHPKEEPPPTEDTG